MANKERWQKIAIKLGSSSEANQKLNHYLPTVEEIAMNFDISVVLDANLPADVSVDSKNDRVSIHIDSFPGSFRSVVPIFPELIFGYDTDKNLWLMEYLARIDQTSIPGFSITSPEGVKVGFVCPGHIFIYPGLLEPELWQHGEDLNILSIILYMVLPEAASIGSDTKLRVYYYKQGYDKVKYLLKSKLQNEDSKMGIVKGITGYLKKAKLATLEDLKAGLADANQEGANLASNDYNILREIVDHQMCLELARASIESRDFGKEFDQILGIDKIKCIRISVFNNAQVIIVFTRPIEQIPSSLDDTRYDIGSFEIVINPEFPIKQGRSAVSFFQSRRLGMFRHVHANNNSPGKVCFGAALNDAVDKLVFEFDIAPLVHLLMNFLVKEGSKPEPNDNTNKVISAPPVFSADSYLDSEDLNSERENFSSFMRQVLIGIFIRGIESKLVELNKKLQEIREARSKIRAEINTLEIRNKDLERSYEQIDTQAGLEANLILGNKNIFWANVHREEILIYFNSLEVDKRGSKDNRGYVLKIRRDQHVQIITPRNFQFLELSNSALPKAVSRELEEAILKYMAQGKISDVLSVAEEVISKLKEN